MLTKFLNTEKKPDHKKKYAVSPRLFPKSPGPFENWTFINVQKRKPLLDFWKKSERARIYILST
jgi:hypothetical protein